MRYLITGGAGFLGSNIAHALMASTQEEVMIFDNLKRHGSADNLKWLFSEHPIQFTHGDIRSFNDIERVVASYKPDMVFHLAGQVAMTTSIENPRLDFEINALGTLNILEALRKHNSNAVMVYSSTNKVYGDLETISYEETATRYVAKGYPEGFNEHLPLDFHSPYGCSKGAGDQYVLDYARLFGLKTVVFRHSSIYGGRQFSTEDQGWLGWFVQQALKTKQHKQHSFTISGNGKQVRDLLYVSDLVTCYLSAAKAIHLTQGQAFNIGGGMKNSLSLLELFNFLEEHCKIKLNFSKQPCRASDQKVFVADIKKAKDMFGWEPQVSFETGIKNTVEWIDSQGVKLNER